MIKDTTFAAQFDKKDMPAIYKLAERIRATHDQRLVDDFNLKCQKKIDDHNPILEGNTEFTQVSKADDLVVTGGINQLIDQILGASVTRWQYMGKGTSTTAVSAGQSALVAESSPRKNMATAGWIEYASSSLRFAGLFGESTSTLTVNECGVFTALTSGIMLNRNMFSNLPLTHIINIDGFVISCVIEFVPVM
jgi:hypothetical protein